MNWKCKLLIWHKKRILEKQRRKSKESDIGFEMIKITDSLALYGKFHSKVHKYDHPRTFNAQPIAAKRLGLESHLKCENGWVELNVVLDEK